MKGEILYVEDWKKANNLASKLIRTIFYLVQKVTKPFCNFTRGMGNRKNAFFVAF